MISIDVRVKGESGLHARPATIFVENAQKFDSEIKVCKGDFEANGKSIMGILGVGAVKDDKLTIKFDGADEKEASETFRELFKETM